MSIDEALLSAADGTCLRSYSWQPSCLSLGYFQDFNDAHASLQPAQQHLDMVRRITGGGAILPQSEVTYCLIARRGRDIPQRTQDAFALLHGHISAALQAHGVDCYLNPQQLGDKRYHQD
jgi:lipoate-protein ligase A